MIIFFLLLTTTHGFSWFPVDTTSNIKNHRGMYHTSILEHPVIITKDLSVFQDSCGHRGVPLHIGTETKNSIICKYHGWTYDTETGLSSNGMNCLKRYKSEIRNNILWINLKNHTETLNAPYFDAEITKRDLAIPWNYVMTNNMDFSHLKTTHQNTIGSTAETPIATSFHKETQDMTYFFEDESQIYFKFLEPCSIYSCYIGNSGKKAFEQIVHVIPLTRNSTRILYQQKSIFSYVCNLPFGKKLFEQYIQKIISEDNFILEKQLENYKKLGDVDWNQHSDLDKLTYYFDRKWLSENPLPWFK